MLNAKIKSFTTYFPTWITSESITDLWIWDTRLFVLGSVQTAQHRKFFEVFYFNGTNCGMNFVRVKNESLRFIGIKDTCGVFLSTKSCTTDFFLITCYVHMKFWRTQAHQKIISTNMQKCIWIKRFFYEKKNRPQWVGNNFINYYWLYCFINI